MINLAFTAMRVPKKLVYETDDELIKIANASIFKITEIEEHIAAQLNRVYN